MSAITLAGTSGRDRDRDTDQVKIKSKMLHNPPDDVNFLRHPWNGSHRQLFNFLTSFTNELKAQSLFRLTLFDKFKEKQRPNAAYRRVDDRSNTRDDDKDIEKYEEHQSQHHCPNARHPVNISRLHKRDQPFRTSCCTSLHSA